MSGPDDNFNVMYKQYYNRIYRYLSLKADIQTAEDAAQLTFVKAMSHLHEFRGESSIFTWLTQIANNTLKNEFRKRFRSMESSVDIASLEHRFISVEFDPNVELRMDITRALQQLSPLDRDIVSLHYDLGSTFAEISEIVGMRISAVKNRLYRALKKLRNELHDWEAAKWMTMIERISVVSKDQGQQTSASSDKQMDHDIIEHLRTNVDRICSLLKHQPSKKLTIEIYPDLQSFHLAVNEPEAPDWFMGVIEGNTIKIASPLNPGPEHTYQSILQSTVHLFGMWLVKDINPNSPKWLYQGIGGYEAGLMTTEYINQSVYEFVQEGHIPTVAQLENNTWDFETMKGFQFSYLLCEYIVQQFGPEALNQLIRTPNDWENVLSLSQEEVHHRWKASLRSRLQL